jgi:hypothetical protein
MDWTGVVGYVIVLATIVFAIAPRITIDKLIFPSSEQTGEKHKRIMRPKEEDLNLSNV